MTASFETDALLKKNQVLLELSEHTGGLMYQLRYAPASKTYSFPFCSHGLQKIYEVNHEQIIKDATPVFNRIHETDIAGVYKVLQESVKTHSDWSCDYRVLLPEKGMRWLRANGSIKTEINGDYLWSGFIYDITQQKHIEKELRDSKERLTFALEGSQDGVWDWNVLTDTAYYSDESIRMLGFAPNEFEQIASFWNDRVHEEDQDAYYADIKRHLHGISPYYSNEHRIRCKDNSYKWILDRGKVIERNENGDALRVIGTHSDITAQKNREQEFLKTIDVVESQNERLLNFTHIVSHNLRSYSGNFESLLELIHQSETDEEKLTYVEYLRQVSSGLSETIAHLNKIVSIQTKVSQKREAIQLHTLVRKIEVILAREIEKKNAIIHNSIPIDLQIYYIPAYLESIVLNLISNAIKYHHPDRLPEVIIDTIVMDDQLILKISDNGVGIDLNKYGNKLFGMYKTFHGNEDAKGIGLFITKNQLVTMGDSIVVRSEVNKGTSFQITFNNKFSEA